MFTSLAPRTLAAYERAWSDFIQFCVSHVCSSFPASSAIVAYYISHCYLKGLAYSIIVSRISVVAYVHKIKGVSDPTSTQMVKTILKGLSKSSAVADKRSPVTLDILGTLSSNLPRVLCDSYSVALCRAVYLFMFHLALRVSEVAVTDNHTQHTVLSSDIEIMQNTPVSHSIRVHFRTYKHSQFPAVLLLKSDSSNICPVASLMRYLKMRPSVPGPYSYMKLANL